MKKGTKTILAIAGFALFLVIVGFMYRYLSDKYEAKNPLTQMPPKESAELSPTPTSLPQSPDATQQSPDTEPQTATPESTEEPELMKALDFTVVDAEGNTVKLSDYEGTPVILNFWASWCPPCKSEMPDFNKVSEEYSKDQLVFLMVDLVDGDRETVESGKKYVADNHFTFTVLYDTKQDAANAYGIRSIPSTLFIDKDGYIQAGMEGAMDEATLRQGIDLIYTAQ